MAKAKISGFHLWLSFEEAEALEDLLSCVGGDTLMSRRRLLNDISRALRNGGLPQIDENAEDIDPEHSEVRFLSISQLIKGKT